MMRPWVFLGSLGCASFGGGTICAGRCSGALQLHVFVFYTRCPRSALFNPFLEEGSPTQIDYGKQGTLILTSQIWRT